MIRILKIGMGWFSEEPGGLNRMYAGLLRALEGQGAAVRGLVAGTAGNAPGVPANVSFFAPRELATVQRLRACRGAVAQSLRAESADVVAAHFALYALPELDLLRKQPFVFHFHGPWASESEAEHEGRAAVSMKRLVESAVYRRADRFVVLSTAFAQVLARQYGVAMGRIFVVPGGVNADDYNRGSRPEMRAQLGLPSDRPLIVAVRRLVHRVGLEGLIEAMVQVRKSVPEALLLIAGGGALAGELAAQVAAHGLADHVRLLGFVADSDLPRLYRACDLSVVPSVSLEGFGLAVIESLAAGTPALVTPVGGLPETVAGLDPALVLPAAGSAALAEGLSRALREPARLPSAERCAAYAREHFDWPVIARQVRAVYERRD